MSEKKEMNIEYNNIKTKISLPGKFSEFKELCIKTFYISELRSQKMNLYYLDEDGDQVPLDENSYEDARNAEFWKLVIDDKKGKNPKNSGDSQKKKQGFIAQKEKLIREAKLYKEKLFGECSRIIEDKIKQKNETHKIDIQKIKDEYAKKLKEFKNLIDNQVKELLGKISESTMKIYMEKSQYIDNKVIEDMSKKLGEFEDNKKDFDVNMGEMGDNINNTNQDVKECKEIFKDIVNQSKSNFLKYIINNVEIENNINALKGEINFKIKIKKFDDSDISNSFLRIKSSDKNNYEDIKIDLSDVSTEDTEKEITFNPNITEIKKHLFFMVLFNNKNIISNVSKLIINANELGSNDDLFS